jgi:hypothetical protein
VGLRPRHLVALLLGLAACAPLPLGETWWNEPAVQLPLWGDRECSSVLPDVALQCCAPHDNAYGVGGTEHDRYIADAEFHACLALAGVPESVGYPSYVLLRRYGGPAWNLTETRSRRPARGP